MSEFTEEQIERAAKEWHESGNGVGSWARSSQHHREIVRKRAARMLTVAGIAPQEQSDPAHTWDPESTPPRKTCGCDELPVPSPDREKLIADEDLSDRHLPNAAYKVGRKIAERGDFDGLDAAIIFMRGAVYGVRKLAAPQALAPEKVADVIHHAFPADSPYRCTHIINAPCVALATALCEAAKRGELS